MDIDISDLELTKDAKVIFMGTTEFAKVILESLKDKCNLIAVVCQPDKLIKNKKAIFSPVKEYAIENELLLLQPNNIKEDYEEILRKEADLIITCAYGQILPLPLLLYPRCGAVNIHASLLPKYRGAAPIQRALEHGETETGITLMYMDEGMDSGDMIAKAKLDIDINDTYETLSKKLSELAKDLMLSNLDRLLISKVEAEKQDQNEVTFAGPIKKEERRIDFSKTKKQIYNKIRSITKKPGAYFIFNGKKIIVSKSYISDQTYSNLLNGTISNIYKDGIGIKCSNGEIVVQVLKPEGKKEMTAKDFLNGIRESILNKVVE